MRMGQKTQFLGQGEYQGTIVVDRDGTVRWQSNAPSVAIYTKTDGGTWTLWKLADASGQDRPGWLAPGHVFDFELMYQNESLAIARFSTRTLDLPTVESPSGGGAPAGSWFEQSTNIMGAEIPNMVLAAGGGGLLLLAVMSRKKR